MTRQNADNARQADAMASEARTGADIPWIFDVEGEEGFRDREQQMLEELTRRLEVLIVPEAISQRLFVFLAQYRNAPDGLDVGIEAAHRSGEHEILVGCSKVCSHQSVSSCKGHGV